MTLILILILCAFSIPVKTATFSGLVSKIEEQIDPKTNGDMPPTKTNDHLPPTIPKQQGTFKFQFSDLIRRANTTIVTKMFSKLLDPGNILLIFANNCFNKH